MQHGMTPLAFQHPYLNFAMHNPITFTIPIFDYTCRYFLTKRYILTTARRKVHTTKCHHVTTQTHFVTEIVAATKIQQRLCLTATTCGYYQKVMSSDVFIDRTARRSCQIETLLSLCWVDYFRNKVCCTSLSSALSFLHDVVHIPEVVYLVLLPCIHLVICNEDVISIYN